MRSRPFSTVFFNLCLPCVLIWAASAPAAYARPPAHDAAVVGVLRFKSHLTGRDMSWSLYAGITGDARGRALFALPEGNAAAHGYSYERGDVISPGNLARYEAICSRLGCTHLLMGRIRGDSGGGVIADMQLYSSAEKRFLCVLSHPFAPGQVKSAAGDMALRISLYLQGRLPEVYELRISKGTSAAETSLAWKCSGRGNNFIISRSPFADGPYEKIGETNSSRFIDTTAEQGFKYWYAVSVTRDGVAGVPASGYGYRTPLAPQGLTVSEMMDDRTRPWPEPGTREEQEREALHLGLFEKYYESPFMVSFIIMVGKMYVNSGELIAFRDFTTYTWEPADRVIYLIKPGLPRIKFHSRRFFRFVRDMHHLNIPFDELLPRVIGNAILFCVRTGDREVRQADGRTRYVPVLEGVGLSTEYHRDYVKWRSNTIVFGTSTDALYKRILEAQRKGF